MPASSATLRHPCYFCDPGDPETTLTHLGFCPVLPPGHLSGRDIPHWSRLLKALILCYISLPLSCSQLTEVPSPCSLSFRISPQIHFTPPTLEKVVTCSIWRVAAILLFHLVLRSQMFQWFDSYLAEFQEPYEIKVFCSSSILDSLQEYILNRNPICL